MWQLHPFFKSPGSDYQAGVRLYLREEPACWKSPRFAHPFGSTELRALLRVATFLQRRCSRVLFTVCVVFAFGFRRWASCKVRKVRGKPI